MNTMKPDDITLTQWIDGELEGEELIRVDAWAKDHPELLAERDALQSLSANIREHVTDSVEPPYPDFFNQRILRAIEEDPITTQHTTSTPVRQTNPRGFWQWLIAPMAAAAMALCFYLGTQVSSKPLASGSTPLAVMPTEAPSVYTPDGAVRSDMFRSDDAKATVIVLEGLEDLPDHLEMAGEPSTKASASMMISTEKDNHIY